MASSPVVPPYGVAIQQAVATGDLRKMKAAASQAEKYLAAHGNVAESLAVLQLEIAKLSAAPRKKK